MAVANADKRLQARIGVVMPWVEKWSKAFGVPPSFVLAICEIESTFRADLVNLEAVRQGGAWGLMQVTWTTAQTLKNAILSKKDPDVMRKNAQLVLQAKWDGREQALFDPEMNVLLGTFYLGTFIREFGADMGKISVAYHNGAGFLRGFLASGKRMPEDLPPKATIYFQRALAAQSRYRTEDDTPAPVVASQGSGGPRST